jgi:pimeloyl-ACP methyl ester carboxylesterase
MVAMTREHERTVTTNGVELHVRDAGPENGPVVVLAHGFPELGYSWRYVIGPIADAGYRVLVPDQRGYGRSSVPTRVEDYDIVHLTGDLLGLLDNVGAPSATFVGHDWGAMVVWQMSVLHPDRLDGVVGVSVPFQRRGPSAPIARMRERFAGVFFYFLYFQDPGVADAELGADPHETMRRLFAGGTTSLTPEQQLAAIADDGRGFIERIPAPERLPDWISEEELQVYADAFARNGFTGPINWYRNVDRNWELTEHVHGAKVEVPSLYIGGSADPVVAITPPATMNGWVTDHRGSIVLDGAGHWLPQERPAEVSAAVLEFLGQIHPV